MPIYESACTNTECALYGRLMESYYPRFESPMNPCAACGGENRRVQSTFAVVFTGPITAKYLDRSKEGGNNRDGGHWVFENGPRPGKGAKPVWIDNWADQKSYCRRNGLALPSEMSNNYEVAEDGRTVKNSVGMPGCEI